ncbi:MAG: aminoacyl-tRNA hydrolase [Acidimicrobiales bacterium]|nr:aminoacyl-tRNA hydrolase [Acidimicrobiales bacterium]
MDDELVAPGCRIPLSEIDWTFTTSGGPGGQHANKAHTRVEAAIDLRTARGINAATRARLITKLGPLLRVVVDDTRSQARNRSIALERLADRIEVAQRQDKLRRKTKPSRGAQKRRLEAKKRRSDTKRQRQRPRHDD